MHIEEANIGESLKKAKDWLGHIHLADSNRFLPGQGHIDFRPLFKVLSEINYKGYMALECGILGKPEEELPKCVNYLKRCI
jgi:sugar phosphate isomerase/epimerase